MRKFWRKWWWVAMSSLSSLGLYFHLIEDKQNQVQALSFRLETKRQEKQRFLAEGEYLRLQIKSQGDPSWIEMILMRDLGVVPEGWVKVHFKR